MLFRSKEAVILGSIGAFIGLVFLFSTWYYFTNQIGSEFVLDINKFIWLILGVVVVGIGITVFSTVFATWRFLKNKNRQFILFLKEK